jgi:hypothetical protein
VVIDSIVVGEVNAGRAVLRSNGNPGDQIFVTGNLGAAAAGLKLIELGARVAEIARQTADGSIQAGAEHRTSFISDDAAIQTLLFVNSLRSHESAGASYLAKSNWRLQ